MEESAPVGATASPGIFRKGKERTHARRLCAMDLSLYKYLSTIPKAAATLRKIGICRTGTHNVLDLKHPYPGDSQLPPQW